MKKVTVKFLIGQSWTLSEIPSNIEHYDNIVQWAASEKKRNNYLNFWVKEHK